MEITIELLKSKIDEARNRIKDGSYNASENTTEQVIVYLLQCALCGINGTKYNSFQLSDKTKTELKELGFKVKFYGHPINQWAVTF